jgi:hypothetical protein
MHPVWTQRREEVLHDCLVSVWLKISAISMLWFLASL